MNKLNINLANFGSTMRPDSKNNKTTMHSRDNSIISYNNSKINDPKTPKTYLPEKNDSKEKSFINKMNKAPSNLTKALKKIAGKRESSKERKPSKNSRNSVDSKRQLEGPTNKTMFLAGDTKMNQIFKTDNLNSSIDRKRAYNYPTRPTDVMITPNDEFKIKDGIDLGCEKSRSKREKSCYRNQERGTGNSQVDKSIERETKNYGYLSYDENGGRRGNTIKINKNDIDINYHSSNNYYY